MNTEYDVTIGLPVYNVEKYIKKSLLSALNQNFDGKIEILVINDCTKDLSMKVVEELKKSHHNGENIHILDQPVNKGLGEARNRIIENFQGKYVYFMDSDDYISNDCIQKLFDEAEKIEANVVYGGIICVDEYGAPIYGGLNYLKQEYKVFTKTDEFASYVFQDMHQRLRDFVTNILYRGRFLIDNHLKFKPVRFYEDVMFSADFVPLISKGVILPDATYNYIIRNDSLSNYQGRTHIELKEIETFFSIYLYIKNKNKELKSKPYYEARCARSMVQMFFIISGILKNRKVINPSITDIMIRNAMKHPSSFCEILKFRNFKIINLAFYMIGILPSHLSVFLINFIAKKKRLI